MKRNKAKMLFFSAICGFFIYHTINSQPITEYVAVVKQVDDSFKDKMESWKITHEKLAIDAYIDPVWKAAVPGYNGRRIDEKSTLQKMKETGRYTEDLLVFVEEEPKVTLEHLGEYPINRGNPNKPAISFMINVAWGNEYLDSILDTLEKYQIKTTFFLDGSWVKRYPELAKKIAERGHEIGNHAYSHPDMSKLGMAQIRQQIGKTQAIIEKTIGIKPTLFAPPSGAYSQSVVTISSKEFQMKTILWTLDTIDWMKPSVDVVLKRIGPKLGNGALILMHPTEPTSKSLATLIEMSKKRGLVPTTVSEVISNKRVEKP